MDPLYVLVLLCIIFWGTCIATICLADADLLTFFASHFGKKPENEYAGKVCWVTGASSGIGESMAKELANCGAKLVLSARRREELIRVKKECQKLNPRIRDGDILILPLDMNDMDSHEKCFNAIMQNYGKLDLLVSNAGRSQKSEWEVTDLEVDHQLFSINVFSLVHMNRIVVRHFKKIGRGQLAVVSSVGGRLGIANSGSYSASKHALHGYFESLRCETYGRNIDITMLCPGHVFSAISKEAFSGQVGKKVNVDQKLSEHRMTSDRCARLCVVAMANRVNEAWIGLFPAVFFLYLSFYQPFLFSKLSKWFGAKYFQSLRRSRED